MHKIQPNLYLNGDVTLVAQLLLGKKLCTSINGYYCSGMITETEAYAGINDKASHAYNHKRSSRNEVMYHSGGIAYVYLCYGLHHLFNVVTNVEGIPHAVLIRAIEPIDGIEWMIKRRKYNKIDPNLSNGPGKLTQALGINMVDNGSNLNGKRIWIEEFRSIPEHQIISTSRIGIDYAEEDALLPYRYYIRNHQWISKK
ncbi:MAG: DNA-3-methyladenine glycosylase [Bacteroidia bacterium]|jgi:DNA-3-methyladenine glycosylase|nr:DNA-3-methyladenine glycosylase [Bacteroidia bacterium]